MEPQHVTEDDCDSVSTTAKSEAEGVFLWPPSRLTMTLLSVNMTPIYYVLFKRSVVKMLRQPTSRM